MIANKDFQQDLCVNSPVLSKFMIKKINDETSPKKSFRLSKVESKIPYLMYQASKIGQNSINCRFFMKELISFFEELQLALKIQVESNKPLCAFCRNNKRPSEEYMSHMLKDANGIVICPFLRRLHCPLCESTGDTAHTISYCPLKKIKLLNI